MNGSSFPVCFDCRHFRGAKAGTCDAFPKHIPEQIWSGKLHHDKAFSGDHGIRFQPSGMIEFLSVEELAKLLNINPKTIYRALWSKSLPAYKIGRTWRIARRDIEHFRK
jgi:excisionase family DNA binding protein